MKKKSIENLLKKVLKFVKNFSGKNPSLLKEQFQKDLKELKDIIHDDDKLFRINRILSNNLSVSAILVGADLLLIIGFNYICNAIAKIPNVASGTDSISSVLRLSNILIPFRLIIGYRTWRAAYLFYFLLIAVLDFFLVYQIRTSYSEKNFNLGQKGTSKWATLEEIQKQYVEIDELETEYDGLPGFPISHYGDKFYIDTNMTNNLIIGITRSGKDETLVFPSLDIYSRAKIKPSLIIADLKGENYKSNQKAQTLQKRGYDVFFMNLVEASKSMGYDPLALIVEQWEKENHSFAEEQVIALGYQLFDPESATGTERYFVEEAEQLFEALCLAILEDCLRADKEMNELRRKAYDIKTKAFKKLSDEEKDSVRKQHEAYLLDELLDTDVEFYPDDIPFKETHENRKKLNMYSVIFTYTKLVAEKILDKKGNPTELTKLDLFFYNRPDGDRAKMRFSSIAPLPAKTKGSIYSTMKNKLQVYSIESAAKMTAESSCDISKIGFGEKPIAVFLGIPEGDKSKQILAVTFIKQVYSALSLQCWECGACDRPVKMVLNEFGNMPKIDNMTNMITVCAGKKITLDLYIQSFSQLEGVYGQDAKTIMSNCGNKVYICTDDDETNDRFSKLVGNETIISAQRNGTKHSLIKTFMETPEQKPLIFPEDMKNLFQGESIVIRSMKKKDKDGEDVYMNPIFNSDKSGKRFKHRFMYLRDYFPDYQGIPMSEVNTESREHIKLKNRVWDVEKSFEFMKRDAARLNKPLCISDLEDVEQENLIAAIKNVIEKDRLNDFTDLREMQLSYAYNLIDFENDNEKLDPYIRKSLLSLLNHYLEREESSNAKGIA